MNKISDPSAASKIVDKNFVVPESKLGNIVPEYKEINNRVNVATNNPASQQVDKHFVAKGPEVNRFITQNKSKPPLHYYANPLQESYYFIQINTCT